MRRFYILSFFLVFGLILMIPDNSYTQRYNDIQFQGFSQTNQLLKVGYQIPYSGVVEIQLFNSEKEIVYFNRYVRESGKHSIPIKKSGFVSSEKYTFVLKYKTSEISGEVPL